MSTSHETKKRLREKDHLEKNILKLITDFQSRHVAHEVQAWDQKLKRFYMNNTTELIANRTKGAFFTHRAGLKEAMIENLERLIKKNL